MDSSEGRRPTEMWHVYVVRANDGRLYTGITTDVDRRIDEHRDARGKGAKCLRGRGPFELAFERRVGERALALKVEHAIKQLSKTEKERLVAAGPDARRLREMLAIQDPAPV